MSPPATTHLTHRGGCIACHHLRPGPPGRCGHRANSPPRPIIYAAREPGQPCGPRAALWEMVRADP